MARVLLKAFATVFLVVVALCGTEVSAQTHHVVGGDDVWSSALNISSWLSGRVFRVGDKIWFTYPAAAESIVELQSLEEFVSCDLTNPIKMYTDGVNHVTLEKEGARYFTSGNLENCQNGMKLPVPVQPPSASGLAPPTPRQPLPIPPPPSSAPTPPLPVPVQPPPASGPAPPTPRQPLPIPPPPSSVPTPPLPVPVQPPPASGPPPPTPQQPLPIPPPPSSVPTPPLPVPVPPPPASGPPPPTPRQPLPIPPPPSSVPTPPLPAPIHPPPATPPTPPSAATSLNVLSIVFFAGLSLSYFGPYISTFTSHGPCVLLSEEFNHY